ncbi:MAG: ATP-binding protein [Verrucomicrobiota bacterium]
MLDQHAADLGGFLTRDAKGRQVPGYLAALGQTLTEEQSLCLGELESLRKNVDHIKDIVAMQQSYATVAGVVETVQVADLVEDAIQLNLSALDRHGITFHREFTPVPPLAVEKHKVLQILINLIRNAKYALHESGRTDKRLTLRVGGHGGGRVRIQVLDNGVGIPPENLTRIFSHGFSTRKDGHGFGLHSAALAARELGGQLTAHSDGPGTGAAFTLELPLQPRNEP